MSTDVELHDEGEKYYIYLKLEKQHVKGTVLCCHWESIVKEQSVGEKEDGWGEEKALSSPCTYSPSSHLSLSLAHLSLPIPPMRRR